MNDYFLQNLARQREKEILKEVEGIRILKAQYAGGRKKRAEIWARLKSMAFPWEEGGCRKVARACEMMDPLHRKDQALHHHPEL